MLTKNIFFLSASVLLLCSCTAISSKVSNFMAKPDTRYLNIQEQPMLVMPNGLKQNFQEQYNVPEIVGPQTVTTPPSIVPPGSTFMQYNSKQPNKK